MINLTEMVDAEHEKVHRLLEGLPKGQGAVVMRSYYEAYTTHREQYGSLRDIQTEDFSLYLELMQKRFNFMYEVAEQVAEDGRPN